MTVYVAVVFLRHGESRVVGVAATEAEAARMASEDQGKPLALSSAYCRGELEDGDGDLVGVVIESIVGKRIEYQT